MEELNHELEKIDRLKTLSLVALASFMFFFYVSYLSISGLLSGDPTANTQAEVKGATTDTSVERVSEATEETTDLRDVSIMVNNSEIGEAVIQLNFSTPKRLKGTELYFQLDGDLEILGVECGKEATCVNKQFSEEDLSIIAIRSPQLRDVVLQGRIDLATVKYNPETSGELVVMEDSVILSEGVNGSVLTDENPFTAVGREDL
jgi:hypothetical protein